MIKVTCTNIYSKIIINGLLCKELARSVHPQCSYTLLPLKYLPISLISIKGIQIGDHEIKILNFSDDTNIFLKDITWLNIKQVILKLYEDASRSKIKFSKAKPYGLEHVKLELINKEKWNGHNFTLKYLELIVVTGTNQVKV